MWRDDPQWAALESGSYAQYYTWLHAPGAPWMRVEAGFDALAALSKSQALPLLVVVFPVFPELSDDSLRPVHDRIAAALASRSIAQLDLTGVYRKFPENMRRRFVEDPLHPTDRGHQVAALAILWTLLEHGWLDGAGVGRFAHLAEGDDTDAIYARFVQRALSGG